MLSDERGNSYEVEKRETQSPLTNQFLKLCSFLGIPPNQILTGVACPFRSDQWNDFSTGQKEAGLKFGKLFWSKVLDEKIKLIITSGGIANKLITEIKDAKIETEKKACWANICLKRYSNSQNTKIVALPHLSRFKLFSRTECRNPLNAIFRELV